MQPAVYSIFMLLNFVGWCWCWRAA